MIITSLQNPKVKELVKLREKRERDKTKLFLVEGYRELLRASGAGRKMEALFYCQDLFLGENEEKLIDLIAKMGAHLFPCTRPVFEKISYRDRPDGLLAICKQDRKTLQDLKEILLGKQYPFLVIAEAVEKPGNLGTILRTADAVGVDAVIVADPQTDVYNPNVVRASVGTLFTVPVVEAASNEVLNWLKIHQIALVATTPDAEIFHTEADFRQALAVAFGTEQLGLSKKWLDAATIQVAIPMVGVADSLNVAISTGVILYEVFRQRDM